MKNYFEIFNLPTNFNIDLKQLESNYLILQQQFHPDINQGIATIENSILINEGYKILSDDFLRASHLLQLKNIDIENDENAIKPDIATLREVLELQEKIFEIKNLKEILELKNQLKNDIKNNIQDFCKHYESNEIKIATQFLIKVKYLKKSLNDLKNKENNLK